MAKELRTTLIASMRYFHSKGWTPGTGGNFSVVIDRDPLQLLMSPSGVDKGSVREEDLIVVNSTGDTLDGSGKSSAETPIHVMIARMTQAQSILHVHSIYNTLLSKYFEDIGGVELTGYEMLKSLEGNDTHLAIEWVPIIPNSQDMGVLSTQIRDVLIRHPKTKGILLSGHGLYTWGRDIQSARRHVEGLEFLFEVFWNEYTLNRKKSKE